MRFQTTIQQSGRTATGIEVPGEVMAALGSGKRPAVTVTVNGYSYRSTVASMGGKAMVSPIITTWISTKGTAPQ